MTTHCSLCIFFINNLSPTSCLWKQEECGDTLTQTDVVAQQYASLPYPLFGEERIAKEEIHYKADSNTEVRIAYRKDITLENINHFLFSGSESFR